MDVWLYNGPDKLAALTRDPAGENLPSDLGPWTLIRFVVLNPDTPDEQEAIALIGEHGYCCFEL